MKILALDYGTKRIGVAFGDTDFGVAFPRIAFKNSDYILGTIYEACLEEGIDRVIVGLPLALAGDETEMARQSSVFADELEDFFVKNGSDIEVEFMDERGTSKSAMAGARQMGLTEREFRGNLDSAAAAIFLQVHLDTATGGE